MAINLLDSVMDNLKGPVMDQIGEWIGETPEKTKAATEGMVPSLLSGLIDMVSKPGGENQLSNVLKEADDSILDKLGSLLRGGQAASTSQAGGNLLTSLFGDNMVTNLISGIAKFAGVNLGSAKSLLGLLAPVVFAAIKRLVSTRGLSLSWLVKFLLGQKDSIAKALPKGLAGLSFLGSAATATGEEALAALGD